MSSQKRKKQALKKKLIARIPKGFHAAPTRLFDPEQPAIFKYFFSLEPFKPVRILYVPDLVMMMRLPEAEARRLVAAIYVYRREAPEPFVFVKHFCKYTSIREAEVQQFFRCMHAWERKYGMYQRSKRL